jgi:co-chaperonin GroES (HSP10)
LGAPRKIDNIFYGEIMATRVRAIKNKVLVTDIEQGITKTKAGVILPDDAGGESSGGLKESGIRPRWARVYSVGPEVDDLKVGEWILISHAKWSRGTPIEENGQVFEIRQVDYPDSILLVTDTDPRRVQFA